MLVFYLTYEYDKRGKCHGAQAHRFDGTITFFAHSSTVLLGDCLRESVLEGCASRRKSSPCFSALALSDSLSCRRGGNGDRDCAASALGRAEREMIIIQREQWPEWLQRLKCPRRFIAGRVEDMNRFVALYAMGFKNQNFHYQSPEHAAGVRTVWPFLLIETKPDDHVAAFVADRVLAAVYRNGNDVIRIPQSVINGEPFSLETSLVASTLVEIARRKEREARKPKAVHQKLIQVPVFPT